ncbi:uncharacterized protein [Macrobrachium rosenbergii]|uniref:uncharacterized protein isoform X2 n=1 Tax=Macrobrachium rosenbergii TaxID=79674 RepID=UPI0034D654B8
MGVSVEVKGGWRINTFLFLLTGSQAVVLPWAPVILKATNLSAQNVGIVMGVITLVGSVGVHGCLAAMKRTHSGAARRLTLLVLTLVGSVLYTTSVLLLPTFAGGNTCPTSSSMFSVISKPHVPPDIASDFPSNVTNSVLDGVTSSLSEVKINSTADVNTQPSSSKTSNLSENSNFSSTAPKETEEGPNSLPSPKPSTYDHGKISTSIHTTTLKKSEATSTTIGRPTQSVKTTLNIVGAHDATTLSVPHEKEKPEAQAQGGITTTVESSPDKTNGSKNFQTGTSMIHTGISSQKLDASKVSQLSFHSNFPTTVTTSETDKHGLQNASGDTTQNSGENTNDTSSSSSDDLYYYYNDEEEGSNSKAKPNAESYRQSHSFMPRKHQHNYKTHEKSLVGQQPEVPPVAAVKENNRLANRKGSFNDYAEGLPLERLNNRDKWSNVFVKPEFTNKVEASKTLHLPRQQSPRLHSAQYRDHEKGRYDPHRKGYNLQSHPLPRTQRKSSGPFDDLYEQRRKRSVNPSQMTTGAEKRKMENAATITNAGNAESRNLTSVDKTYIRSLSINIESPVGIQIGVAILLILGTVASAGIETGVAQLWHCYSHGYDEGGVSQDILHRTITHTFQFSFYAAHKTWSGLTSGAWVIGGGTIAGLLCLMGVDSGVYSILGGMQLALGLCAVFLILVIPVPYGSVDPPKTKRPLSLYLDDEVLREGVRRLAFHIWILANGCVSALSLTFGLWLILEVTGEQTTKNENPGHPGGVGEWEWEPGPLYGGPVWTRGRLCRCFSNRLHL